MRLFGLEAIDRELVAIKVPSVSGIGIFSPVTRTRLAFTGATGGECGFVECMHRSAIWRFEADSHTIANVGRIAIGGFEHEERRFIHAPYGAGFIEVGNAVETNFFENAIIEGPCFGKVIGTDCDMGKNRHFDFLWVVMLV